MDIWRKIIDILQHSGYRDDDLKSILKKWSKISGNHIKIPNRHADLFKTGNTLLRRLKTKSDKEGQHILLEVLRCLLVKNRFGVDALNKILIDFRLPYLYDLSRNTALQNGEFKTINEKDGEKAMGREYDRIFISHSCEDRNITEAFVELLEDIGLGVNDIFYSSLAEYGVSLGENIADTIKKEFTHKRVLVIFMLSKNYYSSVMCLNEMGAAWVMQHAYSSILLPGYEYKYIKGAIDASRIGIKLDGDQNELKSRLIELRNKIQEGFCLAKLDERVWNRKMDDFLQKIAR